MLFKTIKDWKQLTGINKSWWKLSLSQLLSDIILLYRPIAFAEVINTMYSLNVRSSITWLATTFLVSILCSIIKFYNNKMFPKIIGSIYYRLNSKIYNKFEDTIELNSKLKTQCVSLLSGTIYEISCFANTLSIGFSNIIGILIILIIISFQNIQVSLIILTITLFNGLVLLFLNKNLIKNNIKLNSIGDKIQEKFFLNINNKDLINEYNLNEKFKNDFNNTNLKFYYSLKNNNIKLSIKDNLYNIVWAFFEVLIILYLTLLVSNYKISLTLFIIIVPYISKIFIKIEDFFNIYNKSRICHLELQKLNSILNSPTSEYIKLGNLYPKSKTNLINIFNLKLHDKILTLNLKNNCHKIIYLNNKDKTLLLDILKRHVEINSGSIYICNINIKNIEKTFYNNTISIVDSYPKFLNTTIIKNLQLVIKSKKKIYNLSSELNIHNYIKNLKHGYKTDIYDQDLNNYDRFIIGILRAYCSNDSLIIIDFLGSTNESDKVRLQNIINLLSKKRSYLLIKNKNT